MSNNVLINRNLFRQCATKHEGFQWTQNSCYLDSVLWVLFSSPTPFIDNKILFSRLAPEKLHKFASCGKNLNDLNEKIFIEFQMQFRKIAYYFRCGIPSSDCSAFRKLYKKWYNHPQCTHLHKKIRFHSSEQQEAQEFLQFILSLYGMNGQENYGAVSKEDFYYGVSKVPRQDTIWRFIYDRKDNKQSIVWNVPYTTLKGLKSNERTMKNFLKRQDNIWNLSKQYKNCQFNAMRTIHSLTRFSDLFIISLERTHPIQQKVSHFRIKISETITDEKGKQLSLFGIICHHGESANSGHYTAFSFSTIDGQWYYYDDMKLPIKKVGTWQELQTIKNLFTHCVLLFYTKL